VALIPRAPLVTRPHYRTVQQPQAFPNNSARYTAAAVLAVGTALMAQVPTAISGQAVQPFQNPGQLYTTLAYVPANAQVLAQRSAIAVQQPQPFPATWGLYQGAYTPPADQILEFAPRAVPTQQPQPFPATWGLYQGAYTPSANRVVDFAPRAVPTQQPQPFGNLLSLYSAPATLPPLGDQVFDVRIGPAQVQTPQPFPTTFGLYTTLAYIPASAQIPAQVVFVPRWAQTTPTLALVSYSITYQWPSNVVGAQINRAQTQLANVAGAPLTLYSATYTPPSTYRFDVPPTRSVQPQGFAQSAQIPLYQPQLYSPPQAPHFEAPRLLPYSFAYQGFAHAARLALYTTQPAPTHIDGSRRLTVTFDSRLLAVREQERVLSMDLTRHLV
jgi:hypothetical protein